MTQIPYRAPWVEHMFFCPTSSKESESSLSPPSLQWTYERFQRAIPLHRMTDQKKWVISVTAPISAPALREWRLVIDRLHPCPVISTRVGPRGGCA
jgi:hypothetical protein